MSQRGRGNQTTRGLRDKIREIIRLRWVSPARLKCLTKASEKRTTVGQLKVLLLSITWVVP